VVWKVRIAYGVHGYGQGHAARALAVLPDLASRYDVQVYAGGDAYEALRERFSVERIPTMRYHYRGGRRCTMRTLRHNLPRVFDLLTGGESMQHVLRTMQRFAPEVVISDAESWTHAAARRLGIPRIGFDHFGMMVHCRLDLSPTDWLRSFIDRGVYRLLTASPERVLISSFFSAATRRPRIEIIPPLLREEVHDVRASQRDHLLVYLNHGSAQLTPAVLRVLSRAGAPVLLYGSGRQGRAGAIMYRPQGNRAFLEDLASCRAVISTAGNQLVGEALRFGKPMLVLPEATVEQRLNARAIVRLGIGEVSEFESFQSSHVQRFLSRLDVYSKAARRLSADGRERALGRLHQWIQELSAEHRGQPLPSSFRRAPAGEAV